MTNYHAGSATGIDLAAATQSFNERFSNDTHFGWKPLDYWYGGYKAALARATPQHPEAKPLAWMVGDELYNSYDEIPDTHLPPYWYPTALIAASPADAAATQHSVTEQALADALRELLAAYEANVEGADAARDAQSLLDRLEDANDSRAQPLASTAATQPEQASERELFEAWFDAMPEKERMRTLLSGDRMVALKAWEAGRAALAIPASTAASEQAKTELCSPFPGMDEPWADGKEAELDAALAPYETDAASEQQASVSEAERADFEKAIRSITLACDKSFRREKGRKGDYIQYEMGTYWRIWQARAALSGRATIPSDADERELAVTKECLFQAQQAAADLARKLAHAESVMLATAHRATTATPGYKLVPMRPTPSMVEAYTNALNSGFGGSPAHAAHTWEAMLAATPDTATTAAAIEVQPGHAFIAPPGYEVRHVEATTAADQQGAAQAQADSGRGSSGYGGGGHGFPHPPCVKRGIGQCSCGGGICGLDGAAMAAPATGSKA